MRSFLEDLYFGIRQLRSRPGFALLAILTLALGIGANATVFSWLDMVWLHPLPGVPGVERLVAFENTAPNIYSQSTSFRDYRDYRDRMTQVSGLVAFWETMLTMGDDARAQRVWAQVVSANCFDVVGIHPLAGRFFGPEERSDAPDSAPVVVISERFWQKQFRRDPAAIGRTIRLNRTELTVIGVAPASFAGLTTGLQYDLWVPLVMIPRLNLHNRESLDSRPARNLKVLARLRDGATVEQASAEASTIARKLEQENPRTNRRIDAHVVPMTEWRQGAQAILLAPLRILMAMALVVLLIVCANVANLLLARLSARQREFSVRLAMGAGRWRLTRQLLTETLLLAVTATLVAVPLAMWLSQGMYSLLPPTSLPIRLHEMELSPQILLFIAAICGATTLLAGSVPAWRAMRPDINETLKDGGRSGSGAHSHRLRGLLVAGEVALAMVSLVGAALFLRSFDAAGHMDVGFDNRGVAVAQLRMDICGIAARECPRLLRLMQARLAVQPGIQAVSYTDMIPLGINNSGPWHSVEVPGYTPAPGESVTVYRSLASPGHLALLKMRLMEGRDFTDADDAKSARVMIVNQEFARRYFSGRSPVGAHVRAIGADITIVGVVRDAKYMLINEPQIPFFYIPFAQQYIAGYSTTLFVRSSGDLAPAMAAVRREAAALGIGPGAIDMATLTDYNSGALFALRLAAGLMTALGLLALVLAAVGLYGVMSYAVSQRTQEIGIRMALGARPADVLSLVARRALLLTGGGLAAGLCVALAASRLTDSLLVQVSASDPLAFFAAAAFLFTVALVASYIPALRAIRTNPVEALRCQ